MLTCLVWSRVLATCLQGSILWSSVTGKVGVMLREFVHFVRLEDTRALSETMVPISSYLGHRAEG